MGGAFAAEWLKLRKRPATLILVGVYALVVALLGYLLIYLFATVLTTAMPDDAGFAEAGADAILAALLPDAVAAAIVSNASSGGPIALILGVLASGSEYNWRTIRLMVTQRPRRLTLLAAKFGAVTAVVAVLVVVTLVLALVSSSLIAVLEGQDMTLPPGADLPGALASAGLVLLVWAALGLFLGVVFRGTGLAIGIGLGWLFVVEGILGALPFGGVLETIKRGLISQNASALARSFGTAIEDMFTFGLVEISVAQAVTVLGAYVVAFVGIAALVFTRREIT